MLAPHAAARHLALLVQAPAGPAQLVCADPNRLRQILLNLVSNGVRFTEHGGVTVRASRGEAAGQMHIDVPDTGVGIAPEQQSQPFQPFVQLDSGLARKLGGTGLGLSIARHLAGLMHGSLTLASAGEGQGSTFRLSLPVPADVAQPHPSTVETAD